MVLVLLCFLALAAGYLLWHRASVTPHRRHEWRALLRVAVLIAAVRIGALWMGAAAYRNPGWPQGFGYLLQMLALPEIYATRVARATPLRWTILGSIVLAVTSPLWAALLIWVADRLRIAGHPVRESG